jgi:hypothetical protein
LLAFASVYFSESGHFNGLRSIQIEKFSPAFAVAKALGRFLAASLNNVHVPRGNLLVATFAIKSVVTKDDSLTFCFVQDSVGKRRFPSP